MIILLSTFLYCNINIQFLCVLECPKKGQVSVFNHVNKEFLCTVQQQSMYNRGNGTKFGDATQELFPSQQQENVNSKDTDAMYFRPHHKPRGV